MKQTRTLLSSLVFLLLSGWLVVIRLEPATASVAYSCSSIQPVEVVAPDESNRELICSSAIRAVDFLASYELRTARPIIIEVIESPIDNQGYMAYGSYDRRTDRIKLMSLASIQASPEVSLMYDEPFDEEHYGGAVAHEVAHAVMQNNMKVEAISPSPQEYLAHATQLAVLTEERRNRIIDRVDVESWLPGDAISDIYMAMEPTRFAVKSYLHLTSMDSPSAFVTILLNAKWFYVYVP